MRDLNRIPEMIRELQKLWEEYPDQRLGQLVCNIGRQLGYYDPFFMEDDKALQWMKGEKNEECT